MEKKNPLMESGSLASTPVHLPGNDVVKWAGFQENRHHNPEMLWSLCHLGRCWGQQQAVCRDPEASSLREGRGGI